MIMNKKKLLNLFIAIYNIGILLIVGYGLTIVKSEEAFSIKNIETQVNFETKRSKTMETSNHTDWYKREILDKENKLIENIKTDSRYESRQIYTIQLASPTRIEDAQKQFNIMRQSLNKKDLNFFQKQFNFIRNTLNIKDSNFLRIEKVEKYYTVRIGKFENYASAKKFLQANIPQISKALILKAYIKNERIIKLYGDE